MQPGENKLKEIAARIRACGPPLHVGVTGGIASGKTTIADMFQACGAHLIDFDLLAREVVEPGTTGLAEVVTCFGEGILDAAGCLDRKALSAIVFNDPPKRKQLESILHPAIFELFCRKVDDIVRDENDGSQEKRDSNHKVVIFSVIPLLIEMDLQPLFDRVIVVYVSSKVQLERLMKRDGIDEETAQKIMGSQLPIDEKRPYADFLVDNSDTLEKSHYQVLDIWDKLSLD